MRTIPVDISIRPSRSLSPRELDEIWALTERYVDTPRAHYEPRRDRTIPPDTLAFIHRLASDRYGLDWNPETGVVRRSGDKRLRPATAPIDGALLSDPDIRYFETANPGHREGDMLVCLAPLTAGNLLGAIKRRRRLTARASSTRR